MSSAKEKRSLLFSLLSGNFAQRIGAAARTSSGPFERAAASAKLRSFCAVLLLSVGVALAAAGPASSQQQPGAGAADPDAQVIDDLVKANHILAKEGVLDGFGHVSARSLKNPKHFYLARSLAPALVKAADVLEYDENSQPVGQPAPRLYSERFIHGEILRARPDVMAVVHSHSPDVLPFTVTNAPLKALIHTAGFLGTAPAPVFDSRKAPDGGVPMLVTNGPQGAALAEVLGTRPVVLMRGHGMAVAAPNVRQAVMMAVYTQLNARVEIQALKLGTPNFMDDKEVGRVDPIERRWEAWVAASER
jgi:HCOMODA/2-hydroxy-3-carboxy-muconic semialdehyde decarboxylase